MGTGIGTPQFFCGGRRRRSAQKFVRVRSEHKMRHVQKTACRGNSHGFPLARRQTNPRPIQPHEPGPPLFALLAPPPTLKRGTVNAFLAPASATHLTGFPPAPPRPQPARGRGVTLCSSPGSLSLPALSQIFKTRSWGDSKLCNCLTPGSPVLGQTAPVGSRGPKHSLRTSVFPRAPTVPWAPAPPRGPSTPRAKSVPMAHNSSDPTTPAGPQRSHRRQCELRDPGSQGCRTPGCEHQKGPSTPQAPQHS